MNEETETGVITLYEITKQLSYLIEILVLVTLKSACFLLQRNIVQ